MQSSNLNRPFLLRLPPLADHEKFLARTGAVHPFAALRCATEGGPTLAVQLLGGISRATAPNNGQAGAGQGASLLMKPARSGDTKLHTPPFHWSSGGSVSVGKASGDRFTMAQVEAATGRDKFVVFAAVIGAETQTAQHHGPLTDDRKVNFISPNQKPYSLVR